MVKKRQLLLDAALALFEEHGFAHTTIQMILDLSGVSKGTFYKFFSSKDDCILAIMEQRMQEDVQIRKNLETQSYASEFDLLVDQLAVPMTLPEKQRIQVLFWIGLYSGEFDSAELAGMQLKWLSERLVHLYGEEIRPYAYEGAILCYGMLYQIANTYRIYRLNEPLWKELVPKVLVYTDILLRSMQARHEHIFDSHSLSQISSQEVHHLTDKNTLITDLQAFDRMVQQSREPATTKELTRGLLFLLQQDETNRTLLQVVLQAFQREFETNVFYPEARRIQNQMEWYLEQIN
ncbi:TetR/AcrR family transcriptional regulator [Paenibacillus lutrae]|uniref:TetR family transcriptional regulator n=1 Tax=Paenibacillus lutrae TaxID=2078573 RepID=A0A7X3JXW0_9BACL|nr:TetR/AcrR family transcriptional regulator [Paenibacillus lutrae]MVO98299.1 TetR family transcriptional regulator [Paenibacillus lutrae]